MEKNKPSESNIKDDRGKLMMAGLTIVMCGTIVVYFLWAVLNEKFLISFSIDAIAAVIAFVILIRNFKIKYSTINKYGCIINVIILDIICLITCILIKLFVKLPFDFSLLILLLSYFFTKKYFAKLTL